MKSNIMIGKPCVRCKSTERYIATGTCAPCSRRVKNEYQRKRKAILREMKEELPTWGRFTPKPMATPDFTPDNLTGRLL